MGKWKGIVGYKKIHNNCFQGMEKDTVVQIDVLPIQKEQELVLEFISTNSEYKQGVGLSLYAGDGYIEVDGRRSESKTVYIWEDDYPNAVKIFCYSTEGLLSLYNIYYQIAYWGSGVIRSQMDSCGMLIEQDGDKFIYRCNDSGFETAFDSLVFSIEVVKDSDKLTEVCE